MIPARSLQSLLPILLVLFGAAFIACTKTNLPPDVGMSQVPSPPLPSPSPIPTHSLPLAKPEPEAAPPVPPQGPKTKILVRYKENANIAWLFDFLHSRRYYYTRHDLLAKAPHLIVEVPESEKDAFITDMKRVPDIVEASPAMIIKMVVYFQKGFTEEDAARILKPFGYKFHHGGDGQRGKAYFYESGPPFVVYVPAGKLETFVEECKKRTEMKDVYELDEGVLKD